MGISDEDYANAIKKQHQAQRQTVEEMLDVLKAGSITVNATTTGALHYPTYTAQTTIGIKPLREQDLKHDAMKAPLSSLADMWVMRWDNQWVNEQEFMDDDFWRLALIRLLGANKLEKHNLVNQYHAVYRIIT